MRKGPEISTAGFIKKKPYIYVDGVLSVPIPAQLKNSIYMASPLPKNWKKMLAALLARVNPSRVAAAEQMFPPPAPPPVSSENALKTVNEESNRITGWSLLIIGGSLLAILDKEYMKTDSDFKWIYFLYILGWLLLCLSVYWGQRVTRSYLASLFVSKDYIDATAEQANICFQRQIKWFTGGVIVFALWMICFLLLWIFNLNTPI